MAVIGLFSDFGYRDYYSGQVKALLYQHMPDARVYDLMACAPTFDPRASAYLLAAILKDVPDRQLVLAVVDPEVGSSRHALLVTTARHFLIGPDNGLFALAVRQAAEAQVQVIHWRPGTLSASFHGRDLFAPAAIRYLQQQDLQLEGIDNGSMVGADWPDDYPSVIHIDHYGNVITGIAGDRLKSMQQLSLVGKRIAFARTFFEAPPDGLFWYVNSSGLVEISANKASAAAILHVRPGTPVEVF